MCSEPRDQGPSKTPWRARQSPLSSRSKSLLCWDQLVLSSWPSGSDTPPCSLSPLWVLCSFFSWLPSEAEGGVPFPAGREQALEQGGGREAALLVIKHCRGLNK